MIQAVMVLIMVFALFSFIDAPKRENPELIINQGVIIGLYPGANSTIVQNELMTKVKSFILCYNEVDKQKTYSKTN